MRLFIFEYLCNRLRVAVSDEQYSIGGRFMQLRSVLALSLTLLGISAVACFAASGGADVEKPASVAIVELFTSEGCSSCPPADALLREINLKQTNAGQLIVGISDACNVLEQSRLERSILCSGVYGQAECVRFATLPRRLLHASDGRKRTRPVRRQ
jgi:hypothetical protein